MPTDGPLVGVRGDIAATVGQPTDGFSGAPRSVSVAVKNETLPSVSSTARSTLR